MLRLVRVRDAHIQHARVQAEDLSAEALHLMAQIKDRWHTRCRVEVRWYSPENPRERYIVAVRDYSVTREVTCETLGEAAPTPEMALAFFLDAGPSGGQLAVTQHEAATQARIKREQAAKAHPDMALFRGAALGRPMERARAAWRDLTTAAGEAAPCASEACHA